jgi:hypothetical protein
MYVVVKFAMLLNVAHSYKNRNCGHGLYLPEAKPLNYFFPRYFHYASIYHMFGRLKHSSYCMYRMLQP